MNDPINTDPNLDPTQTETQPSSFLARHNDKIIGIFDNELEAKDALDGYQMDNEIELNDTLDILKIV